MSWPDFDGMRNKCDTVDDEEVCFPRGSLGFYRLPLLHDLTGADTKYVGP